MQQCVSSCNPKHAWASGPTLRKHLPGVLPQLSAQASLVWLPWVLWMNTLRRTKMVAAIHVSFCLPRGLFVPTYLPVFPLVVCGPFPRWLVIAGATCSLPLLPQQLSPANPAAPWGCSSSVLLGKAWATQRPLRMSPSPSREFALFHLTFIYNWILPQIITRHKLQHGAGYAAFYFHPQWGFLSAAKFDLLLHPCSYLPHGAQESLPLA